MSSYDSTKETIRHIKTVAKYMQQAIDNLQHRRHTHDVSKLIPPEKPMFDEYTPKLRGLTYGTDEYNSMLEKMDVALQHHYANNSHHPEHYENGINGMSLFDLVEMLVDWKAATLRHDDGDIMESLRINAERFGMSEQLVEIFANTIAEIHLADQ